MASRPLFAMLLARLPQNHVAGQIKFLKKLPRITAP